MTKSVKRAYFEGVAAGLEKQAKAKFAKSVLNLLSRKPGAARSLAERGAFAGAAYAAQPYVEAGIANRDESRPGFTNTRLLTALTAGLYGPRGFAKATQTPARNAVSALGGASVLAAPTMMRGAGERGARALGWGGVGLPEGAKVNDRLAGSLLGEDAVGGTHNLAKAIADLGTGSNASKTGKEIAGHFARQIGEEGRKAGRKAVPAIAKIMAGELMGGTVGLAGGYGIGAVLANKLKPPDFSGIDMSVPGAAREVHRRKDRYLRNKAALRHISAMLGGAAGVFGTRYMGRRGKR